VTRDQAEGSRFLVKLKGIENCHDKNILSLLMKVFHNFKLNFFEHLFA
jgi:hypothetical protein